MKFYLAADNDREFTCDASNVFQAIALWWRQELDRLSRECARIGTLEPTEQIAAMEALSPANFVFCPELWLHYGVFRLGQYVPTGGALQHLSEDDQAIIRVAVECVYGTDVLQEFLGVRNG